jgi:hypothetical protein
MKISQYKTLISSLPVRQHCFITKRKTWKSFESEFIWLNALNDKLFDNKKSLYISRQDVFNAIESKEKIVKVIYWGYPNGMRGNNFIDILTHIDLLENILNALTNTKNPGQEKYIEVRNGFQKVKGIGISTYTKLLYFHNASFNGYPCLILDERLLNVFGSKSFVEFESLCNLKRDNAQKGYLKYLKVIKEVSEDLGTEGENVEQFLFLFGNHLKKQ